MCEFQAWLDHDVDGWLDDLYGLIDNPPVTTTSYLSLAKVVMAFLLYFSRWEYRLMSCFRRRPSRCCPTAATTTSRVFASRASYRCVFSSPIAWLSFYRNDTHANYTFKYRTPNALRLFGDASSPPPRRRKSELEHFLEQPTASRSAAGTSPVPRARAAILHRMQFMRA
jgi:hypothetical protein